MERKDQIRMKRYLPFVIIAAVLAASVGAGVLMFRSSQTQSQTTPTPLSVTPTPGAPAGEASSAATPGKSGSPGAKPSAPISKRAVLIDEFGDYQCPPCGYLHPILKTLKREYGNRIQIEFHQLPLQIHPHALEAAFAAEAAGLQGKFWEMHNLLYDNQSVWTNVGDFQPFLIDYAGQIGLDIPRFQRDMNGLQVVNIISEDGRRAVQLRVESTPTVFIDGLYIPNKDLTIEQLRKEINQRLSANP
jgi:protein-disulfide isomerase